MNARRLSFHLSLCAALALVQGTYTDSTHRASTGNSDILVNGDGTGYFSKWTGGSN